MVVLLSESVGARPGVARGLLNFPDRLGNVLRIAVHRMSCGSNRRNRVLRAFGLPRSGACDRVLVLVDPIRMIAGCIAGGFQYYRNGIAIRPELVPTGRWGFVASASFVSVYGSCPGVPEGSDDFAKFGIPVVPLDDFLAEFVRKVYRGLNLLYMESMIELVECAFFRGPIVDRVNR